MRVLLVSIAFPPKRDPESLQVAKYCKYLNGHPGTQLDVVTSANPTLFMQTDSSLLHYAQGIDVALELKIWESKLVNYLIRKVRPEWLLYPDSKFSFWLQKKKVVGKIEKPDVLYSRSYPVSSTLLALELKKAWNIPWVLHLSDPWAISSAHSLSPATSLKGRARAWNKKKEEECFQLADKICLTSTKTIELYQKEYSHIKSKFEYMPNVYDDAIVEPNPYSRSNKLTFLYTGGFGTARDPEPLLNAIRSFWLEHAAQAAESVQFLFTGEMTRKNQDIFDSFRSIPIIKHLGILPYREITNLQRRAEILINIDSDISDPAHSVFFPSKLLDYMVAQRRILAITNGHSTTHQIVNNGLGDCFEFNDERGIANYFFEVFTRHQKNEIQYFHKPAISEEFSAKMNAKRLDVLFKKLVE